MTALYDHIRELRAELRCCRLTRREQAATEAELAQAIARQAELDRAFDEAVGIQPHRHRAAPDRYPGR